MAAAGADIIVWLARTVVPKEGAAELDHGSRSKKSTISACCVLYWGINKMQA